MNNEDKFEETLDEVLDKLGLPDDQTVREAYTNLVSGIAEEDENADVGSYINWALEEHRKLFAKGAMLNAVRYAQMMNGKKLLEAIKEELCDDQAFIEVVPDPKQPDIFDVILYCFAGFGIDDHSRKEFVELLQLADAFSVVKNEQNPERNIKDPHYEVAFTFCGIFLPMEQ